MASGARPGALASIRRRSDAGTTAAFTRATAWTKRRPSMPGTATTMTPSAARGEIASRPSGRVRLIVAFRTRAGASARRVRVTGSPFTTRPRGASTLTVRAGVRAAGSLSRATTAGAGGGESARGSTAAISGANAAICESGGISAGVEAALTPPRHNSLHRKANPQHQAPKSGLHRALPVEQYRLKRPKPITKPAACPWPGGQSSGQERITKPVYASFP